MKFDDPEEFPPLHDGQVDEDCLTEVFTELGFTVKPHQNLKKTEMTKKLKDYATNWDHRGRAFILIILSHGGKGDVVYGTDTGEAKLHKLQELFSPANCPSLKNAPKVFLIDACRGTESEKGDLNNQGKNVGTTEGYHVMTNSLNFATVFASTRGNAAFMFQKNSGKSGSYFTQTLVEVIKEADENKEFNEIITEVRFRILQKAVEVAKAKNLVETQDTTQEVKAQDPEQQEVKPQDPEQQEVKAQDPKEEVKAQDPEKEVKAQDPEQQEVKAQDPEEEVKAKSPEQEVKAQDPEQQEVKAQDPEEEVKAQDPEEEVKAKSPEQEVKAQDPEQEVKAKGPEQEVKPQDPEQEVKAQDPEQEVKPQDLEQEVKPQDPEEEVKAKQQKEKKEKKQQGGIVTQTVQYTSTLLRLYYIKRNSNK